MSTLNFGSGNTTRYLSIASGFTLPNGDWAFGWWERMNPNAAPRAVFGFGAFGDPNSLLITSQRSGELNDSMLNASFACFDSAGGVQTTNASRYVGDALGANADVFFVVQRRGSVMQGYAVPIGTTGITAPAGDAVTIVGLNANAPAYIGRPFDTGQAWFDAPFGEFFLLTNDSLTAAEVQSLAAGAHITTIKSATRAFDLRFRGSNATEQDQSINDRDAVQVGTGWTTATDFFADGSAPGATISAALVGGAAAGALGTPSNISTPSSAVIGCTTSVSGSGTLKVVLSTDSTLIDAVLAGQIIAGDLENDTDAPFVGSIAVAGTTPSVTLTGLARDTVYHFAIIIDDATDSNILRGSFRTAEPIVILANGYMPNSTAAMADATAVSYSVTNKFPDTTEVVYSHGSDAALTGGIGAASINAGLAAVGSSVYVQLRKVVSGTEYTYGGTHTVVNGNL